MQLALFDKPADVGFRARSYQREAVALLREEFRSHRSLCLSFAPSLGKTKTASLFLRNAPGRALWLADSDFLLDQAQQGIEEVTQERTGLEQQRWYEQGERIVRASIQSLRLSRLLRFPSDTFNWIVLDECHIGPAPTPRQIIAHFSSAKVLGLSATPFRLDKKRVIGEGALFEKSVMPLGYQWAVTEGYSPPVRAAIRAISEIDLSEVRLHGGDLKLGDLEKQIIKAAAPIAHVAWEESNFGELPAIVYTPGVASAKAVAATYRALAVKKWGDLAAVSIDGETPRATRIQVKQEFGKHIRAVMNCDLWTKGADLPAARLIVLGRPTMSLALFIQMALRGARTFGVPEISEREERLAAVAASPKPWFRLIDLAGNSGKHDLVSIPDAFTPELSFVERQCLRKRLEAGKAETLDEAVAEAKKASADEVRRELEANERAIAEAAAQARVTAISKGWDPFSRLGAGEFESDSIAPEWLAQAPTAEQVLFLRRNKIPVKMQTRGTAAALQRQAKQWHAAGLATINQRRLLRRGGVDPNQPYEIASRLIDVLKSWGFHAKKARAGLNKVLSEGRVPGED